MSGSNALPTDIVVTGVGVVGPFGYGVDALWNGLLGGSAALGAFDAFDVTRHRTHIAGQVPAPQAAVAQAPSRPAGSQAAPGQAGSARDAHPSWKRRTSRADEFALYAAREAWSMAGLANDASADAAGVFFGSSAAGMFEGEEFFRHLIEKRPVLHASRLGAQQTNCPGDAIARELGLWGAVEVVASACSAATMAIESALISLRSGETEVALAGGSDGLCQLTYAGFNSLRAVDGAPCRPFRADREGLSIGEGAGVLVLETRARAEARGASVLAVLCGAASSCDAYHMTAPEPAGDGAARAIQGALESAGLEPGAIDFINAHGTGTPHNDAAEWKAFERVFGARAGSIPLTATKAAVGHSLGACGAIEAVTCVLALGTRTLPPAPGAAGQDAACPVDLVTGSARLLERCDYALSTNLAFGGANAALVLSRADGVPEVLPAAAAAARAATEPAGSTESAAARAGAAPE